MKILNRILSVFISLLLVFSVSTCFEAQAISDVSKQKTTISNIKEEISAKSSKDLNKTIKITPCEGTRAVLLQLFNSKQKKYKTVKEYKTKDAHTAELTLNFPKSYRNKTDSKWKIVVKENNSALCASKVIKLTSKNIVNKELSAKAVCVYCVDNGKIIYEKNPNKQLKQASTTKIMTATLLLESKKLGKGTKISKKAAKTSYSTPKMLAGDEYTNKALLHALLLPSSNGAAVAIAEGVEGTTGKFVKKMNAKAQELGLDNTHYANVHGLDAEKHYSSARDVAVLTGYIYSNNKTFRSVISKKSYKIKSKKTKAKTIYTKDMLKDYSKKHKGGKTGHTSGAGYCFSGVYEHKGKTYVVCVLGSKTDESRWKDMKALYNYIDNYAATKY